VSTATVKSAAADGRNQNERADELARRGADLARNGGLD